MCYRLLRRLLFCLPPETAHDLSLKILAGLPLWWYQRQQQQASVDPIELFQLKFPNRLGLAAGFDKNGDAIDGLLSLGFGFVELGAVTPAPQAGNPKPRLLRIPKANALINRLGFNNKGVDYLVERIKQRKLPGIIGVNIGKNLTTDLKHAHHDYLICLRKLYPYVDYVTINISSPNTPDLRQLQTPEYISHLLELLKADQAKLQQQYQRYVPLLIKLDGDIASTELEALVHLMMRYNMDGVVMSNTSVNHQSVEHLLSGPEKGGLSGAPIFEGACRAVAKIHEVSQGKLPIIGVGGIDSPEKAKIMLAAGASLIQLYTGLVYQGPGLIKKILTS
ncbi:MAG: quinone-dependent dihydroorotate dehydrogenase [Gammaproteobacteria bacterium]|nr:quinone-dependent dihydroorotate dehydrogenase [Gammaproteobacteria bacterium]